MKVIIENFEDELNDWSLLEYIHICEIVSDENAIFTRFPLKDLSFYGKCHTPTCLKDSVNNLRNEIDWKRTCLVDMLAETTLEPDDATKFDYFIYGGILGNDPPDGRTEQLRQFNFVNSRNLGNYQMTTNTAVLVTNLILIHQLPLKSIPFTDSPSINTGKKEEITLPFRYVSKSVALQTGMNYEDDDSSETDAPILPHGFLTYLYNSADNALI